MATVEEIYRRLAEEYPAPDIHDEGWVPPLDDSVQEPGSLTPTRKVTVGVLAGAVTVLAVYVAGEFGVHPPIEAAMALTTVVSFLISYLVPGR